MINKIKNRIASRFAYKFGKIFLIMGAVFAVTGIGQASAQTINIRCKKTENRVISHGHPAYSFRPAGNNGCTAGDNCASDSWGAGWITGLVKVDPASVSIPLCTEWEMVVGYVASVYEYKCKNGRIVLGSFPSIFSNPCLFNGGTAESKLISSGSPEMVVNTVDDLLNAIPIDKFKAKMLSAIPDADQQFKAKVMTLLPLPELAKYYDPNRIFE